MTAKKNDEWNIDQSFNTVPQKKVPLLFIILVYLFVPIFIGYLLNWVGAYEYMHSLLNNLFNWFIDILT